MLMDTNKKVCVGCLKPIEPDNLVSDKKSMYWHKSCLTKTEVKSNEKSIPIELGRWYGWEPNSKFLSPSYVFEKLKEIMKEETHDVNNLSQSDETWAKVAKHIVETDKELTEADDPEKLW